MLPAAVAEGVAGNWEVAGMRRCAPVGLTAVLGTLGALALAGAAPAFGGTTRHPSSVSPVTVAPDGPGSLSYFDLARKDCVGTARNTASKVWFTVADGALSDTYWPTVDATNVHTLQYLVSDGSTFTDLQQRDMTYSVADDPTGMACTVTAKDAAHGYKITDDLHRRPVARRRADAGHLHRAERRPAVPPARPAGRRHRRRRQLRTPAATRRCSPPARARADRSRSRSTPTRRPTPRNRNYAVPTYEALEASTGFSQASVGYAGTGSDGLNMLDSARSLTTYDSAPDGHVALTAELPVSSGVPVNVALGFGTYRAGGAQHRSAPRAQ